MVEHPLGMRKVFGSTPYWGSKMKIKVRKRLIKAFSNKLRIHSYDRDLLSDEELEKLEDELEMLWRKMNDVEIFIAEKNPRYR